MSVAQRPSPRQSPENVTPTLAVADANVRVNGYVGVRTSNLSSWRAGRFRNEWELAGLEPATSWVRYRACLRHHPASAADKTTVKRGAAVGLTRGESAAGAVARAGENHLQTTRFSRCAVAPYRPNLGCTPCELRRHAATARNEFICWFDDAKQKMTRERRIGRSQEELEASVGRAAGRGAGTVRTGR